VAFDWLNAEARANAISSTNSYVDGLKKVSPDSGAYLNEAGPEQPNYRHEFWGENYDRLLKIKRDIDPDDVLWCTPCVGNERWEDVGGQLCRVQEDGRK
jgi:berberine-like enzyme